MSVSAEIDYLLEYTEWDRAQWETWFNAQGEDVLALDLGANAAGPVQNIGELVRHIFSAECRYVERIQALPLTDTSLIPANDVSALFAFGRETRARLKRLVQEFPAERWDALREVQFGPHKAEITAKTMLIQSVTHEIRHWAQIATLLRIAGRKTGPHDFLLSGVFERKLTSQSR